MSTESLSQNPKTPFVYRASYEQLNLITAELESFKVAPEVASNISSYPYYIEKYRERKNIDLERVYQGLVETSGKEEIKDNFLHSKEHGPIAQFAEYLPLLANKDGRLGKVCRAKITKTAKPDDEGNNFVDLVVELKIDRKYLEEHPELSKLRPSVSFGLDMTTNPEALDHKTKKLSEHHLQTGKKASVLCYENDYKMLGTEVAKGVLAESEEYLANVAEKLQSALYLGQNGILTITNEERFDRAYREFFGDFIETSANSMRFCADELQNQERALTPQQKDLQETYTMIQNFLQVYKKILITNE